MNRSSWIRSCRTPTRRSTRVRRCSRTLAYPAIPGRSVSRLRIAGTAAATSTRISPERRSAVRHRRARSASFASLRLGGVVAARDLRSHDRRTEAARSRSRRQRQSRAIRCPRAGNGEQRKLSLEGGGRMKISRLTYFADRRKNRIDVLPFNFRSCGRVERKSDRRRRAEQCGRSLIAHGIEVWCKRRRADVQARYDHAAYSSSASQFAYNGLSAAAVAAGHLFPVGYIPDFTADLSYELPSIAAACASRLRFRTRAGIRTETGRWSGSSIPRPANPNAFPTTITSTRDTTIIFSRTRRTVQRAEQSIHRIARHP